jgi:hypothetical protein
MLMIESKSLSKRKLLLQFVSIKFATIRIVHLPKVFLLFWASTLMFTAVLSSLSIVDSHYFRRIFGFRVRTRQKSPFQIDLNQQSTFKISILQEIKKKQSGTSSIQRNLLFQIMVIVSDRTIMINNLGMSLIILNVQCNFNN